MPINERHAQYERTRALGLSGAQDPAQPGPLPNGIYIREDDEQDQRTGPGDDPRRVTWRVTGRNP